MSNSHKIEDFYSNLTTSVIEANTSKVITIYAM